MTGWARTTDGWALNVDGSDAATRFSLPRVELHSSPHGWSAVCLLPDGETHETPGASASLAAAQRAALEDARARLGPEHAAALDALLGAR